MAFWRRRSDEDFAAEVDAHVELETERLVEDGMSLEEARAAARRAFGNATRTREDFHERSRWAWLEQALQDVRYAWRGLRASPAFVAGTVLTLAIGLGLLTTAFSVFNAYVLRPFAVDDPGSLHRVVWRAGDDGGQGFGWRDYDELARRTDLFTAVIGVSTRFVSSDGQSLAAVYVSDNYFAALRPRLLLGRGLTAGDRGEAVAVLGHDAWVRRFAADRAAIGRTVDVDGRPFLVVGVLGPAFGGLDDYPRDIWLPAEPGDPPRAVEITVRLRHDVPRPRAEAALGAFAARMAPPNAVPRSVRAELLPNATANPLTLDMLAVLSPVFAAFALVLLTACGNVSNVMLARAVARQREIAVRLSLGASRSRIIRQLLTEGLLVATLGGVSALLLTSWLLRAGIVLLFSTLPPSLAALLRVAPIPVDVRVFGFAATTAGAATLAFALVPALQASRQPLTAALHGQRSGTRGASRLRGALVVGQVAVSMLLVVCALTLARNFAAVGAFDLGFQTAGIYSLNVRGSQDRLIAPAADALAADPRIADIAVTSGNPLFVTRRLAASAADDRAPASARYTFVSPEFFTMLRLPIARGRAFLPGEARSAARVAIVSEATARSFWPGSSPIGKTLRILPPPDRRLDAIDGYSQVTVVGTVRDVVSGMIVEGLDRGHIYLPARADEPHTSALLFRAKTDGFRPDLLRDTFRRAGLDPEAFEVIPMADVRGAQNYPLRAGTWIGGVLAAVALLLSISGLYGVLSYVLSQRTREIGIRIALGATARQVVGLVVRQSLRFAGTGAIVGLTLAAVVLKALSAVVRLDAVSLLGTAPFAGGVALVLTATVLGAYAPARRATRVDPAETLRAEA
jgi:putative ABC transport system permease protein